MKSLAKLIGISLTGMMLFTNPIIAQFEPITGYHAGALLFSQTSWNGSARITGLGGAQASLGGDISSASGNPAGLGFYNRSEFSLSPSLNFVNANTEYLNSPNSSTNVNFNIGNLGVVINRKRTASEDDLLFGGSFGFSYNRINDFHYEAFYSGNNDTNDFIDFVLTDIVNNGYNDNNYVHALSFDNYLINNFVIENGDTVDGWSSYIEAPDPQKAPRQSERIKSSGSQDQWSFSYGGNIKDRFYFGLSLGLVSLNYRTSREYREQRYPDSYLDYFVLDETLSISGMGINGTFGAIIRPVDYISFGLSYTTPSIYEITDEFGSSLESFWKSDAKSDLYPNDNNFSSAIYSESELVLSQYNLKTAGRINTGATVFLNKNGFITGDIEWIDYSRGRLSGGDIDFQADNENIRELYKPAINFRFGGEYRMDVFRLRAGFNHSGSAYNQSGSLNRSKNTFSGGAGYRGKSLYADLSALYSIYESETSPYDLNPVPIANIDNNKMAFILSFGFLF
ncbi:MAG TPA: hypothetical protein VI583_11575 [Cyclobacteriaceae bacterium]|nr:hypothetical protein [Cyclobacteriaceae bacterium]